MAKSTTSQSNPITGIIHISGEHGSGKTTFAMTYPVKQANSVHFIDDDHGKSREWATAFGYNYHDTRELLIGDDIAVHNGFLNLIRSLKDGNELIILDNSARLFNSGFNVFEKQVTKYVSKIHGTGEIIGGIKWREYRESYLPEVYALLRQKAKTVIIVTHEKPERQDGVLTGAMRAEADPSLKKAARLILRVSRSVNGFVPSGLVVKDGIGKIKVVGDKKQILRCLPDKIPALTWDAVLHYYNEDPISLRSPHSEEIPDAFEHGLITGDLTPEQKRVYEFNKQMAMLRASEDMAQDVLTEYANLGGLPIAAAAPLIVGALQERYPDINVHKVIAVLGQVTEENG